LLQRKWRSPSRLNQPNLINLRNHQKISTIFQFQIESKSTETLYRLGKKGRWRDRLKKKRESIKV